MIRNEYKAVPYKSRSAVARAITGTRWNGLVFFGSRASGPPHEQSGGPKAPVHGLYPQVQRGRARHGVQLARCPARSPARAVLSQRAEGWLPVDDQYDDIADIPAAHSNATLSSKSLGRHQEGGVDVVVVYKIDRLSRS